MKKYVILIVVVAVLVLFAWQCRRGTSSRNSREGKDAAIPVTVAEVAVKLGNLVKANDAVLLTINQLSPIDVVFSAPPCWSRDSFL